MENTPDEPQILLSPTETGWEVRSPYSQEPEHADSLVEAMTLADLIAEEIGMPPPDPRSASKEVRARHNRVRTEVSASDDPRAVQMRELADNILGLEHAIKTRVELERAIGVMAARHSLNPREAFEVIRMESRRTGKPTSVIARVLLRDLWSENQSGDTNRLE